MIENSIQFRIRYGETDKMGYVYYGNYPEFYEMGRTELIRSIGLSYKDIEDDGYILPVKSMEVKYHRAASYDELLTLRTVIDEKPGLRLKFYYEIKNSDEELINEGWTTLVFANPETGRPCKPPKLFTDLIDKYFND